jgi:hypothetical protein
MKSQEVSPSLDAELIEEGARRSQGSSSSG